MGKKILLIIFVLFIYSSTVFGQDKSLWIEPGVGIGNIRLGDDIETVLSKMGEPQGTSGGKVMGFLDYPFTYIHMSKAESLIRAMKLGNKSDVSEVKWEATFITTYSPFAKTRGNISIGASVPDVVKVFGDTHLRMVSKKPGEEIRVECAEANIYKVPENRLVILRPDDFSGHILELFYRNEGIRFFFRLGENIPKVYAISVQQRLECKKK